MFHTPFLADCGWLCTLTGKEERKQSLPHPSISLASVPSLKLLYYKQNQQQQSLKMWCNDNKHTIWIVKSQVQSITCSISCQYKRKNLTNPPKTTQRLSRLTEIKQKSTPHNLLISFRSVLSVLCFIKYNIPKNTCEDKNPLQLFRQANGI